MEKSTLLAFQGIIFDLKEKQLPYSAPTLNREELHRLAYAILPSADIRRDYVVSMVESRWNLLMDGIAETILIR